MVRGCLRNANFITKEPFTHESLLIDKKEYKLSEREKQLAHKEYQHDKKYFPYSRPATSLYAGASVGVNYSHLLNQKYPVNLGSKSMYNMQPGLQTQTSYSSYGSDAYSPNPSANIYSKILNESSLAYAEQKNQNLDFSLHRSLSTSSLPFSNSCYSLSRTQNGNSTNNNTSNNNPTIMKYLNSSESLNLSQTSEVASSISQAGTADFTINHGYTSQMSRVASSQSDTSGYASQ